MTTELEQLKSMQTGLLGIERLRGARVEHAGRGFTDAQGLMNVPHHPEIHWLGFEGFLRNRGVRTGWRILFQVAVNEPEGWHVGADETLRQTLRRIFFVKAPRKRPSDALDLHAVDLEHAIGPVPLSAKQDHMITFRTPDKLRQDIVVVVSGRHHHSNSCLRQPIEPLLQRSRRLIIPVVVLHQIPGN